MNLKDYMRETGKTTVQLAQEIGMSQSTVSMISNGIRKPSINTARIISRITKGLVTLDDF